MAVGVKRSTKKLLKRQIKYFVPLFSFVLISAIFAIIHYFSALNAVTQNQKPQTIAQKEYEFVRYYVPIVHYTDKKNDISIKDLRDLFLGQNKDYRLYLTDEDQRYIDDVLDLHQGTKADISIISEDKIVSTVAANPGSLAIVRFDTVDYRVKSLSVEGKYLWDKNVKDYPLRLKIRNSDLAEYQNRFDPSKITLLTNIGDVILGRHVAYKMRAFNDYAHPWLLMADLLKKGDITFADLETPLSDRVSPPDEGMNFIAPQKAIAGLNLAGIDIVSLANNHSTNYGENAFMDTLDLLKKNNIAYVGGGINSEEAYKPAIIEKNGIKFGFLDYNSIIGAINATDSSAGVAKFDIKPWASTDNQEDIEKIKNAVKDLKKQTDIVVVELHWGVEYQPEPIQSQIDVAHAAVDSGADLIIGTHPHVVCGMESYKNVPVLYSLGNFIFDQEWSIETKQGTIAQTYFYGKKLVASPLIPYQIEDYNQPHLATVEQATQILRRIAGASLSQEFK